MFPFKHFKRETQLLNTAFPCARETKPTRPACLNIVLIQCTVSSTNLGIFSSTELCLICRKMLIDTHFFGVGIV